MLYEQRLIEPVGVNDRLSPWRVERSPGWQHDVADPAIDAQLDGEAHGERAEEQGNRQLNEESEEPDQWSPSPA